MIKRHMFTGIVLVCCAVMIGLVAGCGTGKHPAPASSSDVPYPPLNRFWHWWAAPGIDLQSREGELVRATEEAGYYTMNKNPAPRFPGYMDALAPDNTVDGANRGEWSIDMGAQPISWINYLYKLDVTPDRIEAWVCRMVTDFANDETGGLGTVTMPVRRIVLRRVGERGQPGVFDDGTRPQRPQWRLPSWNVFDGWQVVDSTGGARYPHGETNSKGGPVECDQWKNTELRRLRPDLFALGPIPTLTQYPQWIGPRRAE